MKNLRELNWNPFREFIDLQRQMDRMMDDMWSAKTPNINKLLGEAQDFTPSCDVKATERQYLMSFELPGVKKEDIKIDFQEGMLTVSGERKDECEQKGKNHYHMERFYGTFSRSFQLPLGVKPEQIEASFTDGILKIALPRAEAAKAQQIKIGEEKREQSKISTHSKGERPSVKIA